MKSAGGLKISHTYERTSLSSLVFLSQQPIIMEPCVWAAQAIILQVFVTLRGKLIVRWLHTYVKDLAWVEVVQVKMATLLLHRQQSRSAIMRDSNFKRA